MPPKSTEAQVSKSGIITASDGTRHIPSSTRADGSVRREIKIRPGYRPPEDVEVYKNKTAEAWRNRGSSSVPGAVPGAEPAEKDPKKENMSAAATKNAKRKEARKRAAAERAVATGGEKGTEEERKEEEPKSVDPEVEKEKLARKLAKKLRQARELQSKKEKGEGLLPEQFEKVIKINELIRQLETLGFDTDGQRKTPET